MSILKNPGRFKKIIIQLTGILIFAVVLVLIIFYWQQVPDYKEVQNLADTNLSFVQLREYFKDLSKNKGASYAFEVLKQANLPKGTDTHWLAHTVGDQLYKEKGADGMKICTSDFRSACSHSIVINLFYEKGEDALSKISPSCEMAPGGPNAYELCFHGVGHGVFAYTNYDIPRTLELCKKMATRKHHSVEYIECVGGAIMEQISGGDHDKLTWGNQRKQNFKKDNPIYPCVESVIPDQGARFRCLEFLTPYLWELAGRTTLIPSESVLKEAYKYCDDIPDENYNDKKACYLGFGKEFVPLAKYKDNRSIETLTDKEMSQVHTWCAISGTTKGQEACIYSSAVTIYWSGEVDKKVVERFCQLSPTDNLKDYCFDSLIKIIKKGKKSNFYYREFCNEIPEKLKPKCESELITKFNWINLRLSYYSWSLSPH